MKIQMKMQGGLYGTLELEEIDTETPQVDVPDELQELLRGETPREGSVAEGRSEGQVYELRVVLEDGTSRELRFSEAAFEDDARLKRLVDAIWRQAKPVGGD